MAVQCEPADCPGEPWSAGAIGVPRSVRPYHRFKTPAGIPVSRSSRFPRVAPGLDAITVFTVPNPNCTSQRRRFFQVWLPLRLPR